MKRLSQLSDLVQANIVGNPELMISNATIISSAGPGDLTFALTEKHLEEFLTSDAAAAIVPKRLELDTLTLDGKTILSVDDPELAFKEIVKAFRPQTERKKIGISPAAFVSPTAQISEDVDIYPGAHVADGVEIGCGSIVFPNVTILENSKIGSNVRIYPNAVLYENTIVGDRAIIHSGAVLGAFGFGYSSTDGYHRLSAQMGNVVIGADVEIGANSTVDRGTYDSTRVGAGTKVDNLVMVAHNCQIGEHNLLCSHVGIAGSSSTGDYVVLAGQVGIGDHLTIGAKSTILAQSGVMHNLDGGRAYAGSPAIAARDQMQIYALISKLPDFRRQIKGLRKQVAALETFTAKLDESPQALTTEKGQQEAA